MDVITTAIIAALAAVSTDAIKDSYNALKSALKKKFGSESEVVDAVEGLEKKPDSKGRQATLQEEIENAKVNDDIEIVKLAQELLKQLEPQESASRKYNVEFQNKAQGVQVGDRNTQTNTYSS